MKITHIKNVYFTKVRKIMKDVCIKKCYSKNDCINDKNYCSLYGDHK